ncbi:MAG: ABC transporter substrate-binding protein [Peptoniphilaceae bacterium]
MKKRLLVLTMLVISLFVTSCAARDTSKEGGNEQDKTQVAEGKTQISFWHSMGGVNGEALEELVKRYNESQDDYFVTAEFQGEYDDALTKIRASSAGKDIGADIVQVFDLGTRFMMDSGLIVPIQEYIDKDNYDISKIEPNLDAYYTVDGKLNSMPFNSSTPLLYYNKDIFAKAGIEEAPKSLEEMFEIATDLKEKGEVEMPISMSIYGWWVEQFMSKQEKDMFDKNNGRESNPSKVVFDENGGMESILSMWKELNDKGIAPNVGKQGGTPEFVSGKSAMTFASTASLKQLLIEVGDKFELGTAYFPGVHKSDQGMVSIGGASIYMIDTEDEARKDGAWDFIKFMVSPQSQAYWNAQTGYFPINVDAHQEKEFKDNIEKYPQFKTAIDQLHDSSPESQGGLATVYQEGRQIVEKYLEEVLNDNKTPSEASQAMAKEFNSALENYNAANK